ALQDCSVELQLARQSEKSEVVLAARALNFAAGGTEMDRPAQRSAAMPALARPFDGFFRNRNVSFCRHKQHHHGRSRSPWCRAAAELRQITSSGKRRPAATRFRRIGIYKNKSLLHQRLLIVQRHAVEIDK